MNKVITAFFIFFIILISSVYFFVNKGKTPEVLNDQGLPSKEFHPLSIEYMRSQGFDRQIGSDINIEETLQPGSNYQRYIASYKSEGLKIYALLTIPEGDLAPDGWPVIIFNHGYIPPAEYKTTERYTAYTDAFSRAGYIVFRPDYRGHDRSEGNPEGAYYSPAYTIDVLNAVSSMKKYTQANPQKIGMWGHSMGGHITLRSMVVSPDIKAGVIWAGVVASYEDMAKNWTRSRPWMPSQQEQAIRRPGRQNLMEKYGDFEKNPEFWRSISPIFNVDKISGPVQLHHGTTDEEVPFLFSQRLETALKDAGKTVELYSYEGDNHNISNNLYIALTRSVKFFDQYLKGE